MQCPRCQAENEQDRTRCTQCGAILARAESELRTVTVLFADIRGFTALSEKLSPEEVTQIINECFTLLAAEIEKVDGVIDKFMGDAIMALFGAPRAHENFPERAIIAAQGMLEQLEQFSRRLEQRLGQTLQMRIGINTGPVVAGWIGSPGARSYTVMGDTVNLASRLEHGGRPGAIWVHETTYQQASYAFDFEPVGPLQVKGKSEPVQAYQVKGRKATREKKRGLAGLAAPMLGRQAELAALLQQFKAALQGTCRLVELVGEAGIGKSRLLAAFEKILQDEGQLARMVYLKGRSLPYTRSNTYGVVREIVERLISPTSELTASTVVAAAGVDAPLIAYLLGVAGCEPCAPMDPKELQREIHRAVGQLLRRTAQERPLMLVCEDAHWNDSASLSLLGDVLPTLASYPLFVCILRRPEAGGLESLPLPRQVIVIPPLSETQSYELIVHLLGKERLPDELKQTIVRQASGNPFYVEELLKSLIESNAIAQREGVWRVTNQQAPPHVPDTIRGVAMARIDALPLETRRALELAAVIGADFGAALVSAIARDPAQVAARLEELAAADFIVATGEGNFCFKHLLAQEIVYDNLLVARRRELHRAVARALEEQYAGRLDSQLDALAFHYERGGLWPRALDYRLRAGAWAQRVYANAAAADHFTYALDIISHWERGPSSLLEDEAAFPPVKRGFFSRQRASALTARGDVRALIGQYPEALADYRAALDCGGVAKTRADIHWRIGAVYEKQSRYDDARHALEAGLKLVEKHQHSHARPRLLATLGWVHIRSGQLDLAEQAARHSLELVDEQRAPREAAQAYKTLGGVYFRRGNWEQAASHWQRSLELAERANDRRETGRLSSNLGLVAVRRSRFDEAIDYFKHALESLERIGDVEATATIYNNLGGACSMAGRYDQAREYYQKSLLAHLDLGHALEAARCLLNLGELARKTGDLPAAIDHLTRSRDAMEKLGAAESLPEAHRQLAAAYLSANDLPSALQQGQCALDYARKIGNRLEEGISHRVLGQVARAQFDYDLAIEHLNVSQAILSELNSQDELAQTFVELVALEAACGNETQMRAWRERALEIFKQLGDQAGIERVERMAEGGR